MDAAWLVVGAPMTSMTRRALTQTEEREAWCMALAKAMDAAGASFEDYKREVLRRYPGTKFVDVPGPPLRTA